MNNLLPTFQNPPARKGTFADLLVRHVRDRRDGNAPAVYTAAWIDRRTWSAIVSDPQRPVAKRTAVQFALALRLNRTEADELLLAAGYALSPAIAEDTVFAFCIGSGIFDLFKVNIMLHENGLRIIPPK